MADPLRVAETYVDHIRSCYADDVAIVFYYGSQARGTATPSSDIDLCVIPATERGRQAATSFILDGIGYDFWNLSWQRAERIASLEEPLFSILLDAKVLSSRSQSDLARFEELRARIAAYGRPEAKASVVAKATDCFKSCYPHLFDLRASIARRDGAARRMGVARLVAVLLDTLSILGLGAFAREADNGFTATRTQLEGLVDRLLSETGGRRLARSAEELVERGRRLLVSLGAQSTESRSFADAVGGYYEEARSTFLKVARACEVGDRRSAFLHAMRLQWEIHSVVAESAGGAWSSGLMSYAELRRSTGDRDLPEIRADVDDLVRFSSSVESFETAFRDLLAENGVPVNECASVEDLAEKLRRRCRP